MELRIVEEIPDVEFISYWDEAKYWLQKWPHRYTSNNMRIRQNFEDGEWVLLDEVSDWLQQCVGNGRYMHHYSHFYFETAQDAFAFKLRWG